MSDQQHNILIECVQLLYRHSTRMIPMNSVISLVLWLVIGGEVSLLDMFIWWVSLTLINAGRLMHVKKVMAGSMMTERPRRALYEFSLGAGLCGLAWGLAFAYFSPQLDALQSNFMLLIIAGMGAGAFTSMSSSRLAFTCYSMPIFFPVVITLLNMESSFNITIALLSLVYLLVIYYAMGNSNEMVKASITLHFDNARLLKELSVTNDELARSNMELQMAKEELLVVSRTDGLTETANRRYFDQQLSKEWQRCKRDKSPLTCLMIDIDHFKAYNDYYGHLNGDEALRQVAHSIQQQIRRPPDLLARYGGEEFVVLLPDTDSHGGEWIAERIQKALAAQEIEHAASKTAPFLTLSIGIATATPCSEQTPEDLVSLADNRLYQAKHRGRNTIIAPH